MRTRIALVALGFVMIAGSGSALAQSRAIAIEPRTEVVAPAPVAEAPKAEAPVAEVKVETPKVEHVKVEAPKVPKAPVAVPVKKIIKVAPVSEEGLVPMKKVFKGPTLPLTSATRTHTQSYEPSLGEAGFVSFLQSSSYLTVFSREFGLSGTAGHRLDCPIYE